MNTDVTSRFNNWWLLFAGLVVANAVWLMANVRARPRVDRTVEAYAECRAAIRHVRPEAARIPFPTGDLIRVSQQRLNRYTVRGFFEPRGSTRPEWYTCVMSEESAGWRVDTLTFDRQGSVGTFVR